MNRATLPILVALLLGVLTVYAVGASNVATAQTTTTPKPKHFDPVSSQERKIFDQVVKESYGEDPSKASSARKILARQTQRAAPRLLPQLAARTGLVGAAAGVWTVVGLELYYLPCWECGQQTVKVGSEWKLADGALAGTYTHSNGSHRQSLLTHATAYRESGSGKTVASARAVSSPVSWGIQKFDTYWNWYLFAAGPRLTVGGTPANLFKDIGPVQTAPNAPPPPFGSTVASADLSVSTSGRAYVSAPGTTNTVELCPSSGACVGSVTPPTVDTGSWGASNPTGQPFRATPAESNAIINNVVADPETKPLVDPMDVPETQPDPNWDPDKDPFNPLFDPFAEPEGDPDGDGIPNRLDPDPEGDGDPDGDGDPNEHPLIAPNPDPADDPEGDGDPDGDGDPNETTPSPAPAPLPNDDPDSDPDSDGIPNRDDPDQDNDGIPNEEDPDPVAPTAPGDLPRYHPYADPDTDGSPNRDDKDDDQDGREDWEDDKPFTPSDPGPDTDGDGVPDWSDPWPGNPHAPKDPNRDEDQDGVPDFKDPEITTPYIPWRTTTSDPDAPDRKLMPPTDPDVPYDPAAPPWSPTTPGTPNVPTSPTNPASPPYAPGTSNPPDLSTGISNPPSTRSDVPDDPTTVDSPDVPAGSPGDPPNESGTCFAPPTPTSVRKPDSQDISSLFPFNLLLLAGEIMGGLNATPQAPPVPVLFPDAQAGYDQFALTEFDSQAALVRTILKVAGTLSALFLLYKMFSQSNEGS